MTYPISIGKMDWKTPLGMTRIVNKREKPIWYPPESVRREHEADGRPLPKAVPAGPDNPLGDYAMRLGIPGGAYLIHGTNRAGRCRHAGDARLHPHVSGRHRASSSSSCRSTRTVRHDRSAVQDGLAWRGAVHRSARAAGGTRIRAETRSLTNITRLLVAATQDRTVVIDWAKAEQAFIQATGVPESVMLLTGHGAAVDAGVRLAPR